MPGSRQLAATLLSWRLPKLWPGLPEADRVGVQRALLECFSVCREPPVLRLLGESCNALCQTIAMRQDVLWPELLCLVSELLDSDATVQRKAALDLLGSLVDSMGLRLQPHYHNIGHTMALRVRDQDTEVRAAALRVVGALAESWCTSPEHAAQWQGVGAAVLEVGTAALVAQAGNGGGPHVLAAALRTLAQFVHVLRTDAVIGGSVELSCRILSIENAPRCTEECQVQAIQVIRALARRVPETLTEQSLDVIVPCICRASKDQAPSVDGIDEVSAPALAARECLRALARAAPMPVVGLAYIAARAMSPSRDSLDRAGAVHCVIFALCGAREAPEDWARPLAQALDDGSIWVRQAVCEGAVLLVDALRSASSGFALLLRALLERLQSETEAVIVRKIAEAVAALFADFTTDEAIQFLRQAVPSLLSALSTAAGAVGDDETVAEWSMALAALAGALGDAAGAAMDHFAAFARSAVVVLLPLLQGRAASPALLGPAAVAACLNAAGAVVASAWREPAFQVACEELCGVARHALGTGDDVSEVRASAHNFFARLARVSFEEFAPQLAVVVPPAVAALRIADGGAVAVSGAFQRAVRTDAHEEQVAAANALGAYAAVWPAFATYVPNALPPLCELAAHPGPAIRLAVAGALSSFGRLLAALAGGLHGTSTGGDCAAAAAMASTLCAAVCALSNRSATEGAAALRGALQTKEDLLAYPGFAELAGAPAVAALVAAGGGQCSDDVDSGEDADTYGDD
eukprot:NODE_882_length_2716_cov_9.715720.p1 GENE.NODE_882_length_2716_cov_9.715720~~NODE_882_length_2716_cov_9.715720.p1  ORF type:complete len:797 (+),score=278.92 NODE_882_length_2716_cov_9.715720:139-2391(+)